MGNKSSKQIKRKQLTTTAEQVKETKLNTLLDNLSNLEPYKWRPLECTTHRRFVYMYPALRLDDPIFVSITEHAPETCPRYNAWSYHWGNPAKVHDILVLPDDFSQFSCTDFDAFLNHVEQYSDQHDLLHTSRRITVPENLLLALRRARWTLPTSLVWIDFLCINQDDDFEKAEQVQQMASIYSNAAYIMAYLGEIEPNDGIELVPHILETAHQCFCFYKEETRWDTLESISETMKYCCRARDTLSLAQVQRIICDQVQTLLARPWFSRVWMVQEITPGAEDICKVVYRLGGAYLPWVHMSIAKRIQDLLSDFDPLHRFTRLGTIIEAVECRTSKLVELLWQSQTLLASDLRDHCFAMLGISEYDDAPELRPDYRESVRETFLRYTRFLLQNGHEVAVVMACIKLDTSTIPLPSWAPDWSSRDCRQPVGADMNIHTNYCAGGQRDRSIRLVDTETIEATGFVLERVWHRTDFSEEQSTESQNLDETAKIVTKLRAMHAAYRTLLDLLKKANQPEPSTETIYDYFMNHRHPKSQAESGLMPRWFPRFLSALHDGDVVGYSTYIEQPNFESILAYGLARTDHKQMCVTQGGYLAKVPQSSIDGDMIAIILGFPYPVMLRPAQKTSSTGDSSQSESKDFYQIVGFAYVHGIMDGEAIDDNLDNIQNFTVI